MWKFDLAKMSVWKIKTESFVGLQKNTPQQVALF